MLFLFLSDNYSFQKFSLKICYFGADGIFTQKTVLYMQVGRRATWVGPIVVGKQTKIICYKKKENQQ
jgi:hypothetical protein